MFRRPPERQQQPHGTRGRHHSSGPTTLSELLPTTLSPPATRADPSRSSRRAAHPSQPLLSRTHPQTQSYSRPYSLWTAAPPSSAPAVAAGPSIAHSPRRPSASGGGGGAARKGLVDFFRRSSTAPDPGPAVTLGEGTFRLSERDGRDARATVRVHSPVHFPSGISASSRGDDDEAESLEELGLGRRPPPALRPYQPVQSSPLRVQFPAQPPVQPSHKPDKPSLSLSSTFRFPNPFSTSPSSATPVQRAPPASCLPTADQHSLLCSPLPLHPPTRAFSHALSPSSSSSGASSSSFQSSLQTPLSDRAHLPATTTTMPLTEKALPALPPFRFGSSSGGEGGRGRGGGGDSERVSNAGGRRKLSLSHALRGGGGIGSRSGDELRVSNQDMVTEQQAQRSSRRSRQVGETGLGVKREEQQPCVAILEQGDDEDSLLRPVLHITSKSSPRIDLNDVALDLSTLDFSDVFRSLQLRPLSVFVPPPPRSPRSPFGAGSGSKRASAVSRASSRASKRKSISSRGAPHSGRIKNAARPSSGRWIAAPSSSQQQHDPLPSPILHSATPIKLRKPLRSKSPSYSSSSQPASPSRWNARLSRALSSRSVHSGRSLYPRSTEPFDLCALSPLAASSTKPTTRPEARQEAAATAAKADAVTPPSPAPSSWSSYSSIYSNGSSTDLMLGAQPLSSSGATTAAATPSTSAGRLLPCPPLPLPLPFTPSPLSASLPVPPRPTRAPLLPSSKPVRPPASGPIVVVHPRPTRVSPRQRQAILCLSPSDSASTCARESRSSEGCGLVLGGSGEDQKEEKEEVVEEWVDEDREGRAARGMKGALARRKSSRRRSALIAGQARAAAAASKRASKASDKSSPAQSTLPSPFLAPPPQRSHAPGSLLSVDSSTLRLRSLVSQIESPLTTGLPPPPPISSARTSASPPSASFSTRPRERRTKPTAAPPAPLALAGAALRPAIHPSRAIAIATPSPSPSGSHFEDAPSPSPLLASLPPALPLAQPAARSTKAAAPPLHAPASVLQAHPPLPVLIHTSALAPPQRIAPPAALPKLILFHPSTAATLAFSADSFSSLIAFLGHSPGSILALASSSSGSSPERPSDLHLRLTEEPNIYAPLPAASSSSSTRVGSPAPLPFLQQLRGSSSPSLPGLRLTLSLLAPSLSHTAGTDAAYDLGLVPTPKDVDAPVVVLERRVRAPVKVKGLLDLLGSSQVAAPPL